MSKSIPLEAVEAALRDTCAKECGRCAAGAAVEPDTSGAKFGAWPWYRHVATNGESLGMCNAGKIRRAFEPLFAAASEPCGDDHDDLRALAQSLVTADASHARFCSWCGDQWPNHRMANRRQDNCPIYVARRVLAETSNPDGL